jgi:predicted Na+-dependent transporter
MAVRRVKPAAAERSQKWFARLALLCLLIITLGSLLTGRVEILAYGYQPPLAILGFSVLLAIFGAATLTVLPFPEALAITLSAGIRNIGLSLLIVPVFFTGDDRQAQGRYISSLLYGMSEHDPLALVGAVAVLLGSAMAAVFLPTRRAAALDPAVVLREG